MKVLNIGGKEYNFEFSFGAVEDRNFVQTMFDMISGSYLVEDKQTSLAKALTNGVSRMVAEMPHICKNGFHAGLIENYPKMEREESYELLKAYMKENSMNFNTMFEFLKACMEEDGFFELSGIKEMLKMMNTPVQSKKPEKIPKK